MKCVIKSNKIYYEGWDIVESLIFLNKKKYSKNKFVKFNCKDITSDKYPNSDLMICRDCFIHFSYEDIKKTLIKFIESNIKYILLSNYENRNNFENKDIMTGEARIFDLFKFPFSFEKDYLDYGDDDFSAGVQKKFLLLSRDQVINNLKNFKKNFNV